MPKKKTTLPATEQIKWLDHLPEQGGAWGRSIVQTVEAMESELTPVRKQLEDLSEQLVVREGIVKDAIKRAEKEAKGLFNDKQVAAAKKAAEKAREDAAKAATTASDPEVTVETGDEKPDGKSGSKSKNQPRA